MANEPRQKKSRPSHKKVHLGGVVVSKNGELTVKLNASDYMRHFLKTYAHVGDDVSMLLELRRPLRSQSQNNYWHVYLSLVSLSTGHTIEELKAYVQETILSRGVREVFGESVRIVKSSSDLNISEFVEMVNTFEETTGIPLPDPKPFNLPLTYDEYGHLKLLQTEKYSKMAPKKEFVEKVKKVAKKKLK
jgi:hypothetical protein